MTVLGAAYHEVAVANSRLRAEIERLRAALEDLQREAINRGEAWVSIRTGKALANESELVRNTYTDKTGRIRSRNVGCGDADD